MRYLMCFFCLMYVISAASFAEASIVVKLTEQQMSQKADRIVHGKVVRKYTKWDAKRRRIYTYVIVAVLTNVKGKQSTQEVTIRQLGGARGELGMKVSGTAKFALGEEVFVFLEKDRFATKQTIHQVMGMSYGKYHVVLDKKSQERYLVRDLKNLSVASWNKKGKFQLNDSHNMKTLVQPQKLRTFVKKIQTFVALPKTQIVPKPQLKVTPTLKVAPTVKRPTPTKQAK